MKNCEVGIFRLPGLVFEKNQLSEDLLKEMKEWAQEHKCGKLMTETLWSFKNEGQREWFILRWSDHIPKSEK